LPYHHGAVLDVLAHQDGDLDDLIAGGGPDGGAPDSADGSGKGPSNLKGSLFDPDHFYGNTGPLTDLVDVQSGFRRGQGFHDPDGGDASQNDSHHQNGGPFQR